MRIGVSTKTLLNALKQAEKEREIQNEIAHIQDNILGFNLGMRESATLQIGIPISPMLAKAIKDVEDIPKFYKKFQDRSVMLEYKYDGERTQVRKSAAHTHLFSLSAPTSQCINFR